MSYENDYKECLMQNKIDNTKALLGGLILGGLLGLGAAGAMGGLFGQGGGDDSDYDDDDDDDNYDYYDIEIKSGSIEEAERILDRLDKFCLDSSYDFFTRDDLQVGYSDSKDCMIDCDECSVMFYLSKGFFETGRGRCAILIENLVTGMSLYFSFFSKRKDMHGLAEFDLFISKGKHVLSDFIVLYDNPGCSLISLFKKLASIGLCFQDNFGHI